eukprot:TRINITY_DN8155_c0_g2_i1.p1 TRINITY_DN8155_c0_g2~~TRINITY_DN8155_c0_g2_i1.p1  ORF type:complete len:554 (+),score=83.66 TRINITY_DN8155_c0_g2_i1:125-1786(+)
MSISKTLFMGVSLLLNAVVVASYQPTEIITVPGVGTVQGFVDDFKVEHFLGLKYGVAQRWRSPTTVTWGPTTLNATKYGATCYGSADSVNGNFSMCYRGTHDSEDCLFLNIFRPIGVTNTSRLPVMLYIYGGSYNEGCSDIYSGASLPLVGNVISVTINYRLNVFGFLGSREMKDLNPDGTTGNFGIEDQRLAMKWVNENIASFGGDGNQLTIFGQSAGAGSVAVHMTSKKSWPLFVKAIGESGSGDYWDTFPIDVAEETYERLKQNTSCSDFECLQNLTAAEVYFSLPTTTWAPVIDNVTISSPPWVAFRDGKYNRVPMLLGSNRDEYSFWAADPVWNATRKTNKFGATPPTSVGRNATKQDFERALRQGFEGQGITPTNDDFNNLVQIYSNRSEYPTDLGNWSMWWWANMRADSDQIFVCSILMSSYWLEDVPVYSYMFMHPNKQRSIYLPLAGPENPFAFHQVELPFVLACANEDGSGCEWKDGKEQDLSSRTSSYWVQFAVSGSPTKSDIWPAYNPTNTTLLIDYSGDSVVDNLRKPQCDIFNKYFLGV